DGRGRALDNVFIERLWRTVKYENVYLQGYETAVELECGLASYFDFYSYERLHMALGYQTPWEAYSEGRRLQRAQQILACGQTLKPRQPESDTLLVAHGRAGPVRD